MKNAYVLESTSGIDFIFGPNMPHENLINFHHLVDHITSEYFTDQNKLHPRHVIEPDVVPIVSTADKLLTLVQILSK